MLQNFEILGRSFSFYQLIATAGILATGFFAVKESRRRKLDDNDVIVFFLMIGIGVVVGSHLLYAATQWERFSEIFYVDSLREFFMQIYYTFGGSVFYGGLLGGIAAGSIYLKKKKFSFTDYADLAAPAAALFHTFGRIGCFMSGCCYGIEFASGIVYHYSAIPQANGVPRFPVQLLEAGIECFLFFLLWKFYRQRKCHGKLLLMYLSCYAFARFFLEFLRGDEYRGFLFGLSTSQIISILIFAAATVILLWKRKRKIES